ncbi:leucine-rich repeat neuronal protein 1 [Eucyclogobius newberryi]|uniref:leucine-rich repeat neuronal protein 1 n=1 Tax=Eucyclogobius newberryi TaxID=166745 RepID=UPI003B596E56
MPWCKMGSEVLLVLLSLVMSSVCSSVDGASLGGAVLCPLQCVCETRPWYTPQSIFHQANTVDCNELHLQRVPANVSTDTQVLLLQSNNISSISFELRSLTNLTELDLSQNHITQVSSLDFSSLNSLVTLYLEENRIEVLSDFGLRNLSSLEELYINHNRIRTIETWAFSGLTSLLRLHLNSNRLESIDSRWFDSLPVLEILMLGENPVLVLKEGSFQSLPRLHSLVLASMGLKSVSPNAFTGLDSLESLSFYDNKLRSVPREALKVLPNLKFLDLNRNPMSRIQQGDFQDLLHLEEVSLNNMEQLLMVEPNSFQDLPELIKVELCNNIHLSHLHPDSFSGVPCLRSLMVHSSSLSFLSPLLLSSLPSLKELSVHSNPLRCDCLHTWAAHLGDSSHLTLLEPTLTVCHAPLHLIGRQLQEVVMSSGGGVNSCLPEISSNVFPSVMNVSEGQPITIECWADADPAPQFYWVTPTGDKVSSEAVAAPIVSREEPEGRGLSSTKQKRHHVLEPGALVIDHAEASDTGTYTCVAWNAEGADTKSLSVIVELQNPGRKTTSSESSLERPWLGSNISSPASLVVLAKVVHAQSVVLEWKLHPTKPKQVQNQEQDPPGSLPRFTTATVHIHNPHISYTAKVPADVQEYNLTHLLPSTLYHICLTISSPSPHSLSPAPYHTSCLNVTTKDSAFSVELVASRHGGVAVAAILGSMFALCIMALLLFYMGRRRVANLPQSHAHSLKKYMQHTTSIPLNELYPPLIMLWESEAEKDKEEKEEEHREEGHIDTSKTTYMW